MNRSGTRRLLIHSHNAYGLGHIRRSQAVALHLVECIPDLSVLILTGTSNLHLIRPTRGIDYIKLPCLTSLFRDGHRIGYGSPYLNASFERIFDTRRALALAVTQAFQPHVFLSDLGPGIDGEAVSTLQWIKENSPSTKTVVELTDVLGPLDTVRAKWRSRRSHDVFSLYDSILVFGEQEVFDYDDLFDERHDLSEKTVYCGYLLPKHEPASPNLRAHLGISAECRFVLCLLGAGIAGFRVFDFFLGLASRTQGIAVIAAPGPMLPEADHQLLMERYAGVPRARILPKIPPEDVGQLLAAADVIVTRGGYNSICEAVGRDKPVVVIPIGSIDEEEAVRASRLEEFGLVSVITEEELCDERILPMLTSEYTPPHDPRALRILARTAYGHLAQLFEALLP